MINEIHKPVSVWDCFNFSVEHKKYPVWIGLWIAVAGGDSGQEHSLTRGVMQLCSWRRSSCLASAKQVKEGYVLGALLSTEGAGTHGLSLTFCCWAVALLLTPWDARGPSFNGRDSKAIQKQTVKALSWEVHFRNLKVRREQDMVLPFPEVVLKSLVPPPCWQHCFKDSALPTEEGSGLCGLLGVMRCPETGSVAAEMSRGLDASVCRVPPISKSCTSPAHKTYNTTSEVCVLAYDTFFTHSCAVWFWVMLLQWVSLALQK